MVDTDKCKLAQYPADVLTGPAKPIDKIDDSIRQLVEKMFQIMQQNKGIGLAGPQVSLPLRIFIISLDGSEENLKVFINPTVEPSGQLDAMEEGCLSIPQVRTKIRRYKMCKVTATDLDGNQFTEEAEGLYARCLQHEYDHLQGMTIAERMGSAARIVHRKQLKKLKQEYENSK